ncbi:Activator of 90 kDa heat shock protein ATPase 1 [Thelohanellus kitauei]|uniref:Activator of 90 kDa heat shock protein ATPase 1 n=1 Tax=Thelohanellus kitauei TaxID=669202 RepID=A0A0C2JZD5_THEKT|nr:Activator of 90 kDa heat shock protein ATPase 1 [Thelohanellus kitauei]
MAKAGETNPRWIVEQREDWANVNNWHWDERDMSGWAFDKIKNLLIDTKCTQGQVEWTVTNVDVSGVATVNIRKGRISKIHDIELDAKFKCEYQGKEYEGNIHIPEFSFETGPEKIKFRVTIDLNDNFTELANKIGESCPKHFQPLLQKFLKEFYEHCDGIKLPQKTETSKASKIAIPQTVKSDSRPSDQTQILELEKDFRCPPHFLFDLFGDREKIESYTQSKAKFDGSIGSEFFMLDGVVHGKIFDFVKEKKIVMSWRFSNWPAGFFSQVTLEFKAVEEGTRLSLVHRDIPVSDFERVSQGWNQYFFVPIQNLYGIGSSEIGLSLF